MPSSSEPPAGPNAKPPGDEPPNAERRVAERRLAERRLAEPPFVERVLAVVDAIPPGRVMTYGDVAATLGSRAARMVGQIMAYYGSDVPWWRVVRASGHPPANHEHSALQYYRAESTPLIGVGSSAYRIDLRAARFSPAGDDRHEDDRHDDRQQDHPSDR